MEITTLRHRRADDEPAMSGSDPPPSKHRGAAGIASGSCPQVLLRESWIWTCTKSKLFGLGLLSLLFLYQQISMGGIQLIEVKDVGEEEGSQQSQQIWQQTCEASRSGNMHRPPPLPSSNNNTQTKPDASKHSSPIENEKSSVVVCTIAIHELPYLTEWAEYNLHVLNVAKLYVYDNANTPELSNWNVESVNMGREEGSGQNSTHNIHRDGSRISIIHYPGSKQQGPAYKDCARRALSEGYEYAFFTDVDEFMVLYQHNSITELAVDYLGKGDEDVHADVEIDKDEKIIGRVVHEHVDKEGKQQEPTTKLPEFKTVRNETRIVGSLGMNFRVLGNNCDIEYKALPVSKRFQYRVEAAYPMNIFIKSLVKLKWLDLDVHFKDPHFYKLIKDNNGKEAVKIDTNRQVRGGSLHHMRLYDVAAVHHFLFKSISEYIKKRERGGGTTGPSMSLIENAKKGIDNHGEPIPGGSIYDDEVWKRLVEKVPRYKKYDDPGILNLSSSDSPVIENNIEENDSESCLRPRSNSLRRTKEKSPFISSLAPAINLGMPKMGSSSIHSYFECGGYKSVHWLCGGRYCGDCIKESILAGLPPFSSPDPKCKMNNTTSYAQIDRGPENLIQVNYLNEIMSGVPNATFILPFRNMTKWYLSMTNWWSDSKEVPFARTKDNSMRKRFEVANITGLPVGVGRNVSEFSHFYCEYIKRVRKEVAKYPGRHELIEIDIEDPSVGWKMEEAFGVSRTCWGKSNTGIHHDTVPAEELQR